MLKLAFTGSACLILEICCALNDIWFIMEWSKWVEFNNLIIQVYLFLAGNIYYVPLTHKCILGNLHVLPFSYSPVNTRVGSPIKHYLFIPSIGLSICYMVLCLLLIHRPLFNEIYSNKVPVKWNLQHYKPSSLFQFHSSPHTWCGYMILFSHLSIFPWN